MYKMMIDCNQASFYSNKSQYENLSTIENIKFKSHLMACTPCSDYNKQNKIISSKLNNLKEIATQEQELKMDELKKSEIKENINKSL